MTRGPIAGDRRVNEREGEDDRSRNPYPAHGRHIPAQASFRNTLAQPTGGMGISIRVPFFRTRPACGLDLWIIKIPRSLRFFPRPKASVTTAAAPVFEELSDRIDEPTEPLHCAAKLRVVRRRKLHQLTMQPTAEREPPFAPFCQASFRSTGAGQDVSC